MLYNYLLLPPGAGIYAVINLRNLKVYVGSTATTQGLRGFRERARTHLRTLRKGGHRNAHLQAAFNQDGEDAFVFVVLEVVPSPSRPVLKEREQYWLDVLQAGKRSFGYNMQPAAYSSLGAEFSEEHKRKLSEAKRGKRRRPFTVETREKMSQARLGIVFSEDTLNKMSETRKGRVLSDEHRKKISEAGKGRVKSEETRRKLSESRKGRPLPAAVLETARIAASRAYRVVSPDGELSVIQNLAGFCREKGLSYDSMLGVAQGKTGSCHGWTVEKVVGEGGRQEPRNLPSLSKSYLITGPDGRTFEITNLSAFCREHDLTPRHVYSVMEGKRSHHKGYRCRLLADVEKGEAAKSEM